LRPTTNTSREQREHRRIDQRADPAELGGRGADAEDEQRHGDEQAEARQQQAEADDRGEDDHQRPPRDATDPVAALGLDRQRLEDHDRAEQGHQDAEQQREVAGPGPRRGAERILACADGETDARREEHDAGPEVAFALDSQGVSPAA